MRHWRALLIVYRELDVRLGRRRQFRHLMTDADVANGIESFRGLPHLVHELSAGVASLEYEIAYSTRVLDSLTAYAPEEFWPSPDDTRREIDRMAPPGRYDSVFVFWPQHDFAARSSVPSHAWGLGMGASDWSNAASYAAVANAPAAAWGGEARGEVWLHEWLHGVCHHFAQRGHMMPARDADGAELHGYTRSAKAGWTGYYRDLMNGAVIEGEKLTGIPPSAWLDGRAYG